MSNCICLQCGKAYGKVAAEGDSHGICGQACASVYRAWMLGVTGAAEPVTLGRKA